MMTGEMIWGPTFIKEINEPHSDPAIRTIEEQCQEWTSQMLLAHFSPRKMNGDDYLPAHYRKSK